MTFRCPQCNKVIPGWLFYVDGFDLLICKKCFKKNNMEAEYIFNNEFRYNEEYKEVNEVF